MRNGDQILGYCRRMEIRNDATTYLYRVKRLLWGRNWVTVEWRLEI